jgi:hypothetical protein
MTMNITKRAMPVFAMLVCVTGACRGVCVDAGICKQDPKAMADTVFRPIDALQLRESENITEEYASLESAYQESQVRLNLVRDTALRSSLAGILQQKHQQKYQYLVQLAQALEQRRIAEANARAAEESRAEIRAAISSIEIGTRMGQDNGLVLQLRNSASIQVTFDLKCHRYSAYKTIFVTVPARGSAEVGWMQGWPENFHSGDYCEALYQGEQLWTYRTP